jgi:hypothetical protein
LSAGAGLGFVDRRPAQNLRNQGVVRTKSAKKIHFAGNLEYLAFNKAIGLQKKDYFGISFPDGRLQKQFSNAAAKAAA